MENGKCKMENGKCKMENEKIIVDCRFEIEGKLWE
jgi:hypothetical protein